MDGQINNTFQPLTPKEQATIFTAESKAKSILDELRNFVLTYENFNEFIGKVQQAYFDLSVFINEVNYDVINEFEILPEFHQIMGQITGTKQDSPEQLAKRTTRLWTTPRIDFIDSYRRLGRLEAKSMTLKAILEEIMFASLVKVRDLIRNGLPVEKKIAVIRPKDITKIIANLVREGHPSVEIVQLHPEWNLKAKDVRSYATTGFTGMVTRGEITLEEVEKLGYKLILPKKLLRIEDIHPTIAEKSQNEPSDASNASSNIGVLNE